MASNVSSYLFSGSRGKILLAATLFFLITLTVSFRGRISENVPWASSGSASSNATPYLDNNAETVATTSGLESYDDICDSFPDTSDILVVMKTGATEAYDKLPIHFMSTLRCVKDFVVYSDMNMNMAGYEIEDVLADLHPDLMEENDDFDLYRELQRVYKEHQDPRSLKQGINGWNLDKYKFVPMLDRTWKYRQDAKWYIFLEADTFINWENMIPYLKTFDAEKKHYIGSPTYLDIEFAHGGTGYAISHAAMKKAVGDVPNLIDLYSAEAVGICCGDRMTAKVMLDAGIKLTKAWPMFNGEKALTLPFAKNQWCQPVMTMHHLTAQEVSEVWNFEVSRRKAGEKTPMLWKDIFNQFVLENLRPQREDWENMSGDVSFVADKEKDFGGRKWADLSELERSSTESPDKCKLLCDADTGCFQWQHHGIECQLSFSIKLGWAKAPKDKERWVSGWNSERIDAFRQEMQECKDVVEWTTRPPGN